MSDLLIWHICVVVVVVIGNLCRFKVLFVPSTNHLIICHDWGRGGAFLHRYVNR